MRFGLLTCPAGSLGAGLGLLREVGVFLTNGRRLLRVLASLGLLVRPDMAIVGGL